MSLTKSGALSYEDMPLKISKVSPRKEVKDSKYKQLQSVGVGEFAWAKIRQHRNGLIATAFIAENAWLVWHFIAYGVK